MFADRKQVTCETQRQMRKVQVDRVPAVSLRRSALGDRLNKDPQFLQTHVSSCTHPYDTDAQTITV